MPFSMNLELSENLLFFFPNALKQAKAFKTTPWAFVKLLLSTLIHFISF